MATTGAARGGGPGAPPPGGGGGAPPPPPPPAAPPAPPRPRPPPRPYRARPPAGGAPAPPGAGGPGGGGAPDAEAAAEAAAPAKAAGQEHTERYLGRTIRVATAADGGGVYIDGRPLHLMKFADDAYLSSMCHYEMAPTPLDAARRAVEELRGAALQPSTHGTHVTHL
ncbi:tyrosinase family oxidase copper chaperone [Streptomyces cyaneofuscatus]|uniref:tyrosinase family oxidase copper chaperone n=1 Tax=Streptomyces cyaneofuscatus TaxID=66883 RepID=UPI0036778BE4